MPVVSAFSVLSLCYTKTQNFNCSIQSLKQLKFCAFCSKLIYTVNFPI